MGWFNIEANQINYSDEAIRLSQNKIEFAIVEEIIFDGPESPNPTEDEQGQLFAPRLWTLKVADNIDLTNQEKASELVNSVAFTSSMIMVLDELGNYMQPDEVANSDILFYLINDESNGVWATAAYAQIQESETQDGVIKIDTLFTLQNLPATAEAFRIVQITPDENEAADVVFDTAQQTLIPILREGQQIFSINDQGQTFEISPEQTQETVVAIFQPDQYLPDIYPPTPDPSYGGTYQFATYSKEKKGIVPASFKNEIVFTSPNEYLSSIEFLSTTELCNNSRTLCVHYSNELMKSMGINRTEAPPDVMDRMYWQMINDAYNAAGLPVGSYLNLEEVHGVGGVAGTGSIQGVIERIEVSVMAEDEIKRFREAANNAKMNVQITYDGGVSSIKFFDVNNPTTLHLVMNATRTNLDNKDRFTILYGFSLSYIDLISTARHGQTDIVEYSISPDVVWNIAGCFTNYDTATIKAY